MTDQAIMNGLASADGQTGSVGQPGTVGQGGTGQGGTGQGAAGQGGAEQAVAGQAVARQTPIADDPAAGPQALAGVLQPKPPTMRSVLQTLLEEPARFGFDAALAVMMHAAGSGQAGDAIRFHATTGLGFIAADVASVERSATGFRITTGLLGLTGPSAVLPRPYTDVANAEHRRHAPAMGAFLDLLAQRPVAHYAMAGIKYQPHRAAHAASLEPASVATEPQRPAADGLRHMLLALTGYGTPNLARRLAVGTEPLLFYAGMFAARPRSADRLGAILSDWLGQPVEVEQFAGGWLSLGPGEMSALPLGNRTGQFNRLGVDATIGSRSWDIQSRVRLRIGPLTLARFNALLPDATLFRRLRSLVRAYLDTEIGFAINPVLAAAAVPPLGLTAGSPARLGWNAWLPTGVARTHDATEALFEDDSVMDPETDP